MIQNLWETAKAVLRGKFYSNTILSQERRKTQINNLTLHLKHLEKEDEKKPKISKRKNIIQIRAETDIEIKKRIMKINEAKSWFFEKINKIDKQARLIKKKKKERVQIN